MTPPPPERPIVLRPVGLLALGVAWGLVVLAIVALFGSAALLWILALTVPPGLVVLGAMWAWTSSDLAHLRRPFDPLHKAPTPTPTEALEARLADLAATAARTEARLVTFTSTRATPAPDRAGPDTRPKGPVQGGVPATALRDPIGRRSLSGAAAKPGSDPAKPKPAATSAPTITGVTPVYAEQQQLALGSDADTPQELPVPDVITALNFPEDERDTAGFDALRRALKDPVVGRLVKASQDVLTLLSQDGIYMDDLPPDRAKPAIWRRFAQGERGRAMAALGGVRDRSSLALSAGRMREDVIFRDAAHHFLRLFDRTLMAVEPRATDAELVALTDTRTARAFMLLGRVAGTFD